MRFDNEDEATVYIGRLMGMDADDTVLNMIHILTAAAVVLRALPPGDINELLAADARREAAKMRGSGG